MVRVSEEIVHVVHVLVIVHHERHAIHSAKGSLLGRGNSASGYQSVKKIKVGWDAYDIGLLQIYNF
jgi:hypothetical protein